VLENIQNFNVTDMEDIMRKNPVMSSMFLNKTVGELYIGDKSGEMYSTGLRLPLIFMKMYNYAGKSQNTKWSEMSPM